MVTRKLSLVVGLMAGLLTFASVSVLRAGEKPVNPDEELLREAKVGTDGPGLLAFFRDRIPADEDVMHPERLVEQLASPSFAKREEASRKLIRLEGMALPLVRQAESDPDAEVARRAKECAVEIRRRLTEGLALSAVRLLGRQRPEGGADILLKYLPLAADEETIDEIWHVVEAEIEGRRTIPQAFIAALEDALPARRALAASIVARFGNGEQRASVRSLLQDKDSAVRLRAAQGLLAKNDPAGVSALIPLLEDRSLFIAWQAEELLHWVGGDSAPDVVIGSGETARHCRTEWDKWWEAEKTKIAQRLAAPKWGTPALLLVCEEGDSGTFRLWLCGCDGKPRWQVGGLQQVESVQLTPQETILLAESFLRRRKSDDRGGRFSEVTPAGKPLWEKTMSDGIAPVGLQRLANGDLVAITRGKVQFLDVRGKEIGSRDIQPPIIGALGIQRVGNRFRSWSWERGEYGSVLIERWIYGKGPRTDRHLRSQAQPKTLEILSEDHLLEVESRVRVVELRTDGETLWEWRNPDVEGAIRLRGGGTVIWCGLPPRMLLVDGGGRVVWEAYPSRDVRLVAACLPLLRVGFGRLENLDDLSSMANRIKALTHKDAQVRAGSARALEKMGENARQAIPALIKTLGDKNPDVREAARYALDRMGKLPLPELRKALTHEEPLVRAGAVPLVAAHWRQVPSVIPELIKAARDQDSSVRAAALLFLAGMGGDNPEVVPLVIQGLQDEHIEVRQAAAYGLGSRGGNPKLRAVIPALIAALKDKDEKIGFWAAVALGKIGAQTDDVIPALIQTVTVSDARLSRQGAVMALGTIGRRAKAAVPALVKILQTRDMEGGLLGSRLQMEAAYALGQIGPAAKMAVPVLAEIVQDRKLDLVNRAVAARALGEMGDTAKPAVPALAATLQEPPTRANRELLESIGTTLEKLGKTAGEAIPTVQLLARDGNHPLNEFFSNLLEKLRAAMRTEGRTP
jgi:HEAT repeat protein